MKLFPLKPMSQWDRMNNLLHIMANAPKAPSTRLYPVQMTKTKQTGKQIPKAWNNISNFLAKGSK